MSKKEAHWTMLKLQVHSSKKTQHWWKSCLYRVCRDFVGGVLCNKCSIKAKFGLLINNMYVNEYFTTIKLIWKFVIAHSFSLRFNSDKTINIHERLDLKNELALRVKARTCWACVWPACSWTCAWACTWAACWSQWGVSPSSRTHLPYAGDPQWTSDP